MLKKYSNDCCFPFFCKDCGEEFEVSLNPSHAIAHLTCPKCKSENVTRKWGFIDWLKGKVKNGLKVERKSSTLKQVIR